MTNKVQVVGGNSDIGFCIAKNFAKEGFQIQLISKNLKKLEKKKIEIETQYNVKCEIIELDIEQKDKVKLFLDNQRDDVSIIIMAVGYLENEEKNYIKILNLNYRSLVFYIENALVKYSKNNVLKTIIGISSIAGDRGKKKNNIYSSAKAGFSNYLDGLRQRLYNQKINVITVKPGYVKTKMTINLKLPKFLVSTPDEVSKIIFKSFKKNKTTVYVPRYWKYIMIIYKLLPEIFFKLLINFRK